MTIDVIIPVYKPDKTLLTLLDLLGEQSKPIQKIILMNTEKSLMEAFVPEQELLKRYDNVSVFHVSKAEFDHGKTRHEGIQKSDADIVLCMTQDAIPADKYLVENLMKALQEDEVIAAYARQLPGEDCSPMESYMRSFNYPDKSFVKSLEDLERLKIKTYFCSNVCCAYKRELYEKMGGFIRRTIFNEDMIFAGNAIKAGYKVAYVAEAKVVHSHNYSCIEQLHRNFDLGVSQADHPEIFSDAPSEGEGVKSVMQTAKYLTSQGKWYLVPYLVMQSGFKYLGYLLGKNYKILPKKVVLGLSMNKEYWK